MTAERGRARGAPRGRDPLDRGRVVAAAVEMADAEGVAGVTMRALARSLGVEAMSLYNHVAHREDLLDGMVDAVFAEIALPDPDDRSGWRTQTRARAESARAVLRRHPWAVALMDSRSRPGPATLRHHDAVLGVLRRAGFSVPMAAHAVSLVDSYLYGFVLQEIALPFGDEQELESVATGILDELVEDLPYLVEIATEHALRPGYAYAAEFDFGLTLILDALAPDGAGGSEPPAAGERQC